MVPLKFYGGISFYELTFFMKSMIVARRYIRVIIATINIFCDWNYKSFNSIKSRNENKMMQYQWKSHLKQKMIHG